MTQTQAFKVRVARRETGARSVPSLTASRPPRGGRGDAPKREREIVIRISSRKARIAAILAAILFVSSIAAFAVAVVPSFSTIVQPGSQTAPYTYTIFGDGVNVFARHGQSGAIAFSGSTLNSVWTSTIAAMSGGGNPQGPGSIFLKKLLPSQETYVSVGIQTQLGLDYVVSSTLYVPDSVSVYSDGATLDVRTLNAAVLYLNAGGYLSHQPSGFEMDLRDINMLGSMTNTNTTGVYVYRYNMGFVADHLMMRNVYNGFVIEGEVYRGLIENCMVSPASGQGGTGVLLKQGAGVTGPNQFRVVDNDFEGLATGVNATASAPTLIGNYFESNNVAVNLTSLSGGQLLGNSIAVGTGARNIGIFLGTMAISTVTVIITGNGITTPANTNAVGIWVAMGATQMTLDSNYFGIGAGATAILAAGSGSIAGQITGNTAVYGPNGLFISGPIGLATISGNFFRPTGPAFYLNGSNNAVVGNEFYGGNGIIYNGFFNTFTGNIFNSVATYSLQQNGAVSGNRIIGNELSGTTPIVISAGSTPTIHYNQGYVSENSGTKGLSTNTTYAIPHGLALTPTVFAVTLSNPACGAFGISAIGAAYFTVTVATACTATIYWYASISP